MRKINVLLLLCLPLVTISQQTAKETEPVIFTLNAFANDGEKKLFREISTTGKTDYFQLLLQSDQFMTNRAPVERIESFIQSKEWIRNKKEINVKDLKRIYKEVHEAFLVKYVDNPAFGQIFQNGNYNCATASALYAFLLDKFAISYAIRETPTHVYIVAAPETNNVMFETTTPGAQIMTFNDKVKTQFVDYLYENKMISKDEYSGGDKSELFNKYFYSDKPIGIKELCGLLYYNKGIEAMQAEKYLDAYRHLEKSYFLYPEEKLKYFLTLSLTMVVYKEDQLTDDEKLPYYFRYIQLDNKKLGQQMIAEYVTKARKKLLFQNPDLPKYHTMYRSVLNQITDTGLVYAMRHDHYKNCAHYFEIKNQSDSLNIYLDSLYRLNTNDILVQEMIIRNTMETLQNLGNEKQILDTLNSFFNRYPFIKANARLQEFQIFYMTKVVNDYYDVEDAKAGKKYLDSLKALLDGQPALAKKSEKYLEMAIGEVCGYYVRKQDYKSARDLLVFMKKLLPDNEDFERRLTHVSKQLNSK